jgi:hypothetical protein
MEGGTRKPRQGKNGEIKMSFESKLSQVVSQFTKSVLALAQEQMATQLGAALKGTGPRRVVGAKPKAPRASAAHLGTEIMETLTAAEGTMTSSALYAKVAKGATEAQFGYALRGLKEEGKVVQVGSKRNATYTIPGREPVAAPETPAPVAEPAPEVSAVEPAPETPTAPAEPETPATE